MDTYKIITPAYGLPVSLTEFKEHLGIYHTEKDDNLTIMLNAAIAKAESFTGCVFRTGGEVIEKHCAVFEDTEINRAPVTGVDAVYYFDSSNSEQTLGTAYWDANVNTTPAAVTFTAPPATYTRHDAVKIRFVAGYDSAFDVPYNVKAAILMFAQYLYENPGDSVKQLPTARELLLRDFKLH